MKIEELEELLKTCSERPINIMFENKSDTLCVNFLVNNAEKFLALWEAASDLIEEVDYLEAPRSERLLYGRLDNALEDLEK